MTISKSEKMPAPVAVSASDPTGVQFDTSLLKPFTLQDVVDVACFSRYAVAKLPSEEELCKRCGDQQTLSLLIEGSRVLRVLALSEDAIQLDAEEVQVQMLRFVQIESILGVVSSKLEGRSCIGQAQAEKVKCKDDCKKSGKKFCGCFWNSFLAKIDCLVDVEI